MIAFAHGFPDGLPDKPRRRHRGFDLVRKRLDTGQWLALFGCGLIGVGVFLPFLIFVRLGQGPSLWQQEADAGWPLRSLALLTLGALSAYLAWRRWYVFLWLTGFAAYMALALGFLLSAHLASLGPETPGELQHYYRAPDHFHFGIGWHVLVIGILLLFAGAIVDGLLDNSRSPHPLPVVLDARLTRSDPWWLALNPRGDRAGEG